MTDAMDFKVQRGGGEINLFRRRSDADAMDEAVGILAIRFSK